MALFSADQIIGKTLTAKSEVPIKRLPQDNAPNVFTVQPNQSVGVVYSWLNVDQGRSTLYWVFLDKNGRQYYAPHLPGYFSISNLSQQGALTVKEEQEAEAKKNESLSDILQRNFKLLLIVAAVAIVAKQTLPELIKKK